MSADNRADGALHRSPVESAQHSSTDQQVHVRTSQLLAAWTGADDSVVAQWLGAFDRRRRTADAVLAADADPLSPEAALRRLRRNDTTALDAQQTAAREALALLLRPQIGKYIARQPDALEVINLLRRLGGEVPPGISICEVCGIVFEPRRKSFAAKCEMCRSRPHSPPPLTVAVNDYGHFVGTGMPGRTERWAIAGCAHAPCSAPFEPRYPTMRFCSTKCRKAAHRAASAQDATPSGD